MTTHQIPIGRDQQLNVDVMLEEGQRILLQATSGAGKSETLRLILEQLPSEFQQVIFDVEDEMHVLRSPARPYVILGGEYADHPGLWEMDPGELAIAILKMGTSVIFQIGDKLPPDQAAFMAAYLHGLMRAPRAMWRPLVMVMDEAHRYAPQKSSMVSHDAVYLYASAGRKRLFSALFATPRISDFSASVRGVCNNRLIGRVDSSVDRATAADSLGVSANSPEAKALEDLKNGQFWLKGPIFGPKRLAQLNRATTKPPKAGVGTPPAAAPAALVKALAALPRPRAEDAGPPAEGVRIEKVIDHEAVRIAREEGERKGIALGKEIGVAETFDNLERLMREQREIIEAGGHLAHAIGDALPEAKPPRPPKPLARQARSERKASNPVTPARQSGSAVNEIANALVWWASIGQHTPTREALAESVGMAVNDREFSGALAKLLSDGQVGFVLPSGVKLKTPAAGPKNGPAVIAAIRERLTAMRLTMYDTMLGAGETTKSDLFRAIGVTDTGSSRGNILSLIRMGIFEQTEGRSIHLAAWARGEKERA